MSRQQCPVLTACSQKAEELEGGQARITEGPSADNERHLCAHELAAHEQPVCLDGAAASGYQAFFDALDAPKRRRPRDKSVELSSESLRRAAETEALAGLC